MVPCWTHMGKAMWEPCGNYMGPVWEKSTHIYLPGKTKKKKKKKKKSFTHFYTNDYVPSPSPFDGLVRSQMREAYVHVQVIAHAYNQDALKL